MKISQELTPAAYEFAGCTSAACAPPNKKGTGGSGGSIKGQTAKGGGPNFKADTPAAVKSLSRTVTDMPNNAGGGRSSMKSSVDMDKSRAIAAARGDSPSTNTRNRDANGNPPGTTVDESDWGDAEHRAHDAQTTTVLSKAAQRAIDFKREQAKHNSRNVEADKRAEKKRRENSARLAEYEKMIRDRNRIL